MTKDEALERLRAEWRGLLNEGMTAPRRAGQFPTDEELAREGRWLQKLLRHGADLFDRVVKVSSGPATVDEPLPAKVPTNPPPGPSQNGRPQQPAQAPRR